MVLKGRELRHARIRKKVIGTPGRPRLCVFRSLNHLSAQLIDDTSCKVILGLSTNNPDMKSKIKSGGNVKAAQALGQEIAAKAKEKGLQKVVFWDVQREGF